MTNKEDYIEKIRKKWNESLLNVSIKHITFEQCLSNLAYTQHKEIKKQNELINGAECGYGSLKEQGYWSGAEHADKHYKPIIEKLEKENTELKQSIGLMIPVIERRKKTHISIDEVLSIVELINPCTDCQAKCETSATPSSCNYFEELDKFEQIISKIKSKGV